MSVIFDQVIYFCLAPCDHIDKVPGQCHDTLYCIDRVGYKYTMNCCRQFHRYSDIPRFGLEDVQLVDFEFGFEN